MEYTFPRHKELCKLFNISFEVIDMRYCPILHVIFFIKFILRWGIRNDEGAENLTTELCIKELKKCLHIVIFHRHMIHIVFS